MALILDELTRNLHHTCGVHFSYFADELAKIRPPTVTGFRLHQKNLAIQQISHMNVANLHHIPLHLHHQRFSNPFFMLFTGNLDITH